MPDPIDSNIDSGSNDDLDSVDIEGLADAMDLGLATSQDDNNDDNVDDAVIIEEKPDDKPAVVDDKTPPPPAPPASEALPSSWKPDFAPLWQAADPALRAQIIAREAQFHEGIEQYKEAAGFAVEVKKVFEPYKDLLAANGMDEVSVTNNLLQAQVTLAYGKPEDRVALIQSICNDYGIKLPGVGEAPPEVASLNQKITDLQSRLDQTSRALETQQRSMLTRQVTAFMADPKFPHAATLAGEMAVVLKGDPSLSLEQAYEKALWINPSTREQLLADKVKTEEAAKQEQARKDAEAAAKARKARGVRPGDVDRVARVKNTPFDVSDLDKTLQDGLKEINSRN